MFIIFQVVGYVASAGHGIAAAITGDEKDLQRARRACATSTKSTLVTVGAIAGGMVGGPVGAAAGAGLGSVVQDNAPRKVLTMLMIKSSRQMEELTMTLMPRTSSVK